MADELEAEIAALIEAGAFDDAATRAVEIYGSELYGFLFHVVGDEHDSAEVFSQVSEDLWRGLPSFRAECSVRTWLYVIARHAAARFRRSPWNQRGRRIGDSRLESAVELARSRTQPWLRTEVKDQMHELRRALDPDDCTMLVLRVDRQMAWEEIARIMLGSDASDDAAIRRESSRLRKRFQLVKSSLRRRARELGLLDDVA